MALLVEGTAGFVTRPDEVQALVERTVATLGSLDYAVNNAGIAVHKELTDVTPEEFDRVIAINLKGVFLGLKYAIPAMVEAGGARSSTWRRSPD